MTINAKTEITTEYVGMGLTPDGTWKKITARTVNGRDAEQWLKDYIDDVRNNPELFTAYVTYKCMKRTVITVTEEWRDAV